LNILIRMQKWTSSIVLAAVAQTLLLFISLVHAFLTRSRYYTRRFIIAGSYHEGTPIFIPHFLRLR
ncbi:MAG: hypothetical protein WCF03_15980, partial [Nitrososphaeraceae archaeon]